MNTQSVPERGASLHVPPGIPEDAWRVVGLGEVRRGLSIKQAVLARKSGVVQQTISGIEVGSYFLSPAAAVAIAPHLSCARADDLRLAHNLWVVRMRLKRGMGRRETLNCAKSVVGWFELAHDRPQKDAITAALAALLEEASSVWPSSTQDVAS